VLSSPQLQRLRSRAQSLLAEQRALVGALLKLREQIGGSLIERYVECRKEGCGCRQGRRHGPYFILSARSGGQGTYAYLNRPQVACVRQLVRRHRDFRERMRRLQRVNAELVGVLQRYRAAATRVGERRVREAAQVAKA